MLSLQIRSLEEEKIDKESEINKYKMKHDEHAAELEKHQTRKQAFENMIKELRKTIDRRNTDVTQKQQEIARQLDIIKKLEDEVAEERMRSEKLLRVCRFLFFVWGVLPPPLSLHTSGGVSFDCGHAWHEHNSATAVLHTVHEHAPKSVRVPACARLSFVLVALPCLRIWKEWESEWASASQS